MRKSLFFYFEYYLSQLISFLLSLSFFSEKEKENLIFCYFIFILYPCESEMKLFERMSLEIALIFLLTKKTKHLYSCIAWLFSVSGNLKLNKENKKKL